jgi:chorismate dehydratase
MFTVGTVPWLNAVPLLKGLDAHARVVAAVPALLSARLAAGELDAALLPVAEAIRGVGVGFLGRHGIASEGPVASVLLFLRRPLSDVRDVVLDPASRTGAALARYVVERAAAGPVRFRAAARPGPDPAAEPADAVLVIGDPALEAARGTGGSAWAGVLDLGQEWTRETGLPFVFARWTGRAGLTPAERTALAGLLEAAADRGLPDRVALAGAWAESHGTDARRAAEYVQRHVRYRIGPREEEALARFAAIVGAQDEADRAAGASRVR